MANKKKVLIAEDEEAVRSAIAQALEAEGIEAIQAPDGQAALDLALEHHPDLIVLDVIMPKMHGIEVVKNLDANTDRNNIPIIILTNFSVDGKVREIVQQGRAELLVKNEIKLPDLVKKVKDKLGK